MRRILFEIPSAQAVAWIVAALAVGFALYHAFRKPRKDEEGNREPFPIGSVAGGAAVAFLLVWGVARNDEAFREDVIHLKGNRTLPGKVLAEEGKTVKLRSMTGLHTVPKADVVRIERNVPKGIPIYSYGFMMMAAFAAAIYVGTVRARNAGLDPNVILDLGLWTMISGILGARPVPVMLGVRLSPRQYDKERLHDASTGNTRNKGTCDHPPGHGCQHVPG